MQAGKLDGERVVACVVVLGAHLLFWWALTRATAVFVAVDTDADTDALQVTWIDPPPAAPIVAAVATDATPSPPSRSHPRKPVLLAPATPASIRDAPDAAPRAAMSAVFIEQGRQWIEAQADRAGFARDPLANRSARVPGRQADSFRMRKPISPQAVVNAVGSYLFAPPGYTTDPCAQINANIAGLGPGGDGALLQEELRRKRAYCH